MHQIVGQRLAVAGERDAPAQAIQGSGQGIEAALGGARREPPCVNQLRQDFVAEAGVGQLAIEHRLCAVDEGRRIARDAARAIVVAVRFDTEFGRMTAEQTSALRIREKWNAERIVTPRRRPRGDRFVARIRAQAIAFSAHRIARAIVDQARHCALLHALHAGQYHARADGIQAEHTPRRAVVIGYRGEVEHGVPGGVVVAQRAAQRGATVAQLVYQCAVRRWRQPRYLKSAALGVVGSGACQPGCTLGHVVGLCGKGGEQAIDAQKRIARYAPGLGIANAGGAQACIVVGEDLLAVGQPRAGGGGQPWCRAAGSDQAQQGEQCRHRQPASHALRSIGVCWPTAGFAHIKATRGQRRNECMAS